jgi:hypothetical protein
LLVPSGASPPRAGPTTRRPPFPHGLAHQAVLSYKGRCRYCRHCWPALAASWEPRRCAAAAWLQPRGGYAARLPSKACAQAPPESRLPGRCSPLGAACRPTRRLPCSTTGSAHAGVRLAPCTQAAGSGCMAAWPAPTGPGAQARQLKKHAL